MNRKLLLEKYREILETPEFKKLLLEKIWRAAETNPRFKKVLI
jgi:hypothetical protein